jgi:CheY-like chemotaxis protein
VSKDVVPAGEFVCVCIRDNGHGMSSEVQSRAIEPFFTTKPPGKGTGLGLSQVYGIATQAGGAMRIESELGKGTSIYVYLRIAASNPDEVAPKTQDTAVSKEEAILIVDDDSDVRTLIEDYLRELRYRTRSAPDGETAMRLMDEFKPDMLVADFAMPGNNGAEVARTFRQRFPNAPVLFVSGYADTTALEDAVGKAPLLRKPFRPSELAAAIRSLLD